jgi:hypothetical protein
MKWGLGRLIKEDREGRRIEVRTNEEKRTDG